VNQVLEDMLRAYTISFHEKWDDCLKLAEFSYNNSYQESIRMGHLKLYTEESVGRHSIGLKWETTDTLGLSSSNQLGSGEHHSESFEGSSKLTENLC